MSSPDRARLWSFPRHRSLSIGGAPEPPAGLEEPTGLEKSTGPEEPTAPTFDRVADQIAGGQHGVVTRQQLLGAGVSKSMIDRRLATGRLKRLHRGVYLVGPVVPPLAFELAACLACGRGTVVSHRSAAALWGFLRVRRGRTVDVSVRPGGGTRRPGIAGHRPREVEPDETTVLEGVPITTPSRTLYDLARVLRPKLLERAVSEALACGHVTSSDLEVTARRYARRPGGRRLAAALGEDGPSLTRSEAEARFLRLARRAGLPSPRVNRVLAGYEVDFHWPDERLVVEIDGFAYHGSRRAFERDRARDADLSRAGFRVVRVTWNQLLNEPLVLAARLGALLGSGSRGWPSY